MMEVGQRAKNNEREAKPWVRLLGGVFLFLMVLVITWKSMSAIASLGSMRDRQRILYYKASPMQPVRLAVDSKMKKLRLTFHRMTLNKNYRPTLPVHFEISIMEGSKKSFSTQVSTEGVISSKEQIESVEHPSAEITLAKTWEVMLPSLRSGKGELVIESNSGQWILFRAYVETPRSAWRQETAQLGLTRKKMNAIAQRWGWIPYDQLSQEERDASFQREWIRMSAVGEEGKDFESELVWFVATSERKKSPADAK